MAIRWNFRNVLNINPDNDGFTCQSSEEAARCKNPVQLEDRVAAGGVLCRMDRTTNNEIIFKGLEELATLTLCRDHQISTRQTPGADEVYSEWNEVFRERWTVLRRENSRKAAEGYKLNKMKKNLARLKVLVDEENERQASLSDSPTSTETSENGSYHRSSSSSYTTSSPTEVLSLFELDDTQKGRDTFKNNRYAPSSNLPTKEPNFENRSSLRDLVQSALYPSPPETPTKSTKSTLEEGVEKCTRGKLPIDTYSGNTKVTTLLTLPLNVVPEDSSIIDIGSHAKHLRCPSTNNSSPAIPLKSPRRPKSVVFSPQAATTFAHLPSIPIKPDEPPSPISSFSNSALHSRQSSIRSSTTISSQNSSSFCSQSLKSHPHSTPSSMIAPKASYRNYSTPVLRSPTPKSPMKLNSFLSRSHSDVNCDYSRPSLDFTPDSPSYGTIKPLKPRPRTSISNTKLAPPRAHTHSASLPISLRTSLPSHINYPPESIPVRSSTRTQSHSTSLPNPTTISKSQALPEPASVLSSTSLRFPSTLAPIPIKATIPHRPIISRIDLCTICRSPRLESGCKCPKSEFEKDSGDEGEVKGVISFRMKKFAGKIAKGLKPPKQIVVPKEGDMGVVGGLGFGSMTGF